jgi:hypothetical protein
MNAFLVYCGSAPVPAMIRPLIKNHPRGESMSEKKKKNWKFIIAFR